MTTEEIFMHSAAQVQNSREFEIDPSLGNSHHSNLTFHQETSYRPELSRQSIPTDVYGASYGEADVQMLETRSDGQDEIDSVTGTHGPVKKTSKSSAANELEMRQLFQANKHRSLPEVATELHGNERGPQSERQRQVFAMLW